MNQLIRHMAPVDLPSMDLVEQFQRCEQWNDPQQWEFLAMAYYMRGFMLNAYHCFQRADALRMPVAVETAEVVA